MLSYSWSCQKPLVERLQNGMISQGIDVWRDETGSDILGPLEGDNIDHMMASSINNAKLMIMFVSKAYENSANCMQEAMYAKKKRKAGKVDILFVMVDPDYNGDDVDGTLGIMIGSALWYPLFDESQLADTTSRLVEYITRHYP